MSTQTEHVGLHQWESTDPFLREDFNEDNRKIDEAVKQLDSAPALMRLGSIVTEQDANQVDIELTDIDFSQYWEVRFYLEGNSNGPGSLEILLNGISTSESYQYRSSNGGNYPVNHFGIFDIGYQESTDHYTGKVTIFYSPIIVSGRTEAFGLSTQDFRAYAVPESGISFSTLKTLNLFDSMSKIKKGMTITIYGVKR